MKWTAVLVLMLATACASIEPADVDVVGAAEGKAKPEVIEGLRQGANPGAKASDGTTALHWAAHHGDVELAKALIEAGAEPNIRNDYGVSPLEEAATVGDVALLEALLKAGADPNLGNLEGQTPLMIVARSDNLDAARLLLRYGADVNRAEDWRSQTALMWASAQSQPAMVKLLIENGARVDARSKANEWERQISGEPRAQWRPAGGMTPLLYAGRQGCLECVRHLAEAQADLNLADPEGVTPLMIAINNFHFDVAAYLIKRGADPNKWDWWGRSPLYLAADVNTIPFGGRPDRPSLDDTTSIQVIELLLQAGANPNAQLKLFPPFRSLFSDRGYDQILTIGTTPLIRAAKAGDAPATGLLLKHGAHANLANSVGITPLLAAAGVGSQKFDTRGTFRTEPQAVECIRLLLNAGADIHLVDRIGRTALHGAGFWGWNEAVQILVDAGARVDTRDKRGLTPADWALGKGGGHGRGGGQTIEPHEDTAKLLNRLAARTGSPAADRS